MQKLLIVLTIVVSLVSACFIPNLCAQEVVRAKIEYPEDPMLTHNYTLCVRDLPDPYNPDGKIDPFITLAQWDAMDKPKEILEAAEIVKVPDTVLTRLDIQQYDLTGIVIGEAFRWAFFTSGEGKGRAYKGAEGDYIGRDGIKIQSIDHGNVQLSNGNNITKKAW